MIFLTQDYVFSFLISVSVYVLYLKKAVFISSTL